MDCASFAPFSMLAKKSYQLGPPGNRVDTKTSPFLTPMKLKMHRRRFGALAPVLGSSLLSVAACLSAATGKETTAQPQGIVLDDDAATYQGAWVRSTKQTAVYGPAYRHDNHQKEGPCQATFTPQITEAGEYEVRLCYVPTNNRSTRTKVTLVTADGTKEATVDQRLPLLDKSGVPRAIGVFRFDPKSATPAALTVTNDGADGFVVVDAVQFIPVALAKQEREGKAPSGWKDAILAAPQVASEAPSAPPTGNASRTSLGTAGDPAAAAAAKAAAAKAALSPLAEKTAPRKSPVAPDDAPVRLATSATPAQVQGANYDVIVIGGTGSGVVCAVRAAREGCRVLLVQHNDHIGGMMTNGLMQWDALYGGPRAPLFTELLRNIEQHYVERFGKDSPDHQTVRYTHEHYPISWGEPHVVEREFNRLVAAEKNVTLLLSHYPVQVDRQGGTIRSVTLCRYGTQEKITVQGATFVDATYEGDLFALAKVPYRVGREARDEYNEPHAGKAFVNIDHGSPTTVSQEGLNIRNYSSRQGTVDPTSPFTADGAIQAYNYRFCVTKDPANRVLPTAPPPGYNREEYVKFDRKSIATNAGPNLKSHMNSPILPGENHAYPEATWAEREKIIDRHKNFALGLIWFLQNDESISEKAREGFRQWGLPKDEFQDHGHIPYEMYVREARRMVGLHVFTSHDNTAVAPGARTPVHADSIAITDWYMDSHSCTKDSRPGYKYDGKLILTEESRPAQIPYRSLLSKEVDNLLVPVCVSSTHVAWGAIRLEPVWMQTGEAAGFAAAQARRTGKAAAAIDSEELVRSLAQQGQLVSFFNDVKVDAKSPVAVAAQYFGTQGFFHDYQARLDDVLRPETAALWDDATQKLKAGKLDAQKLAQSVAIAESKPSPAGSHSSTAKTRGAVLLEMWQSLPAQRAH